MTGVAGDLLLAFAVYFLLVSPLLVSSAYLYRWTRNGVG